MRRYETLETLFGKVDLSFAEKVLNEAYHPKDSPGRPPRKPLGVFKAHLLRRLRHVPSDRMFVRQLWKDPRLRRICDIEKDEPPYGITVLSMFRKRVGHERLMRIVDHAVELLVSKGRIKGEAVALDSTFIKANSRRSLDNRTGYSDPESRVGRAVKTRELGYRLHLAVDCRSEMPVAMTVASANENEKKHSLKLFEKASFHVKPQRLLADPQYSSATLREAALKQGTVPVIPYPRNQMKGVKSILRIDRKFRSHGPSELRRAYRKRGRGKSVQQTQEPHKPNTAQPQRTSQNNVPHTTLSTHHPIHSSSRSEHWQTRQSKKHQALRKLISEHACALNKVIRGPGRAILQGSFIGFAEKL